MSEVTVKAKRVQVSDEVFVAACLKPNATIASIAAETGMQVSSVQQRRVRLRKVVAVPALQRGGGRKATPKDVAALTAMVAKATGQTEDEVTKLSQELAEKSAKRAADKAAAEVPATTETVAEAS
jgi:hypothetical protein